MRIGSVPSTVVVCCSVPARTTVSELVDAVGLSRRYGVPVTWATGIDSIAMMSDAIGASGSPESMALEAPQSWFASRQSLRQFFARSRTLGPALDALVVRGNRPLVHRDALVEEGIRTACVDHFETLARGSRRPSPAGWACRSVVWGLWEVRSGSEKAPTLIQRIVPWASFPRLASGSLSIFHVQERAVEDSEPTLAWRSRLERLLAWVQRTSHSQGVRVAGLSDLPALLNAAGRPHANSVLKAA